jgi:alpha-mannosidase
VHGVAEFEFEGISAEDVLARDFDGRDIPVQRIQSAATVGGRHRRLALAASIPPLGYRIFRLIPVLGGSPEDPGGTAATDGQPAAGGPAPVAAREAMAAAPADDDAISAAAAGGTGRIVLDNGIVRAELDASTGWLASLTRAGDGVELIPEQPGPHAVVLEDLSDTWSHGVAAYDTELGAFGCRSARVVEAGPVRTRVRVESGYGHSTLVEDLILTAGAGHIEVRAQLDWHERQRLVKLRFPCALGSPKITSSIPYGHIGRPSGGTEEPTQAWVDVSGTDGAGRTAGLSVVNDGKHGYDACGAEIGLTVARSPVYAWHDPRKLDPGEHYQYLDQGCQEFSYGVLPHAGDWSQAGTVRLAEELNQPLIALPEHAHPGDLPTAASFLDGSAGPVVVSVLKRAEDGGGVVVRAYESGGMAAHCRIGLGFLGRSVAADFAPGEIKTFFVPDNPELPVREVSLLEWPPDAPAGSAGNALGVAP